MQTPLGSVRDEMEPISCRSRVNAPGLAPSLSSVPSPGPRPVNCQQLLSDSSPRPAQRRGGGEG